MAQGGSGWLRHLGVPVRSAPLGHLGRIARRRADPFGGGEKSDNQPEGGAMTPVSTPVDLGKVTAR